MRLQVLCEDRLGLTRELLELLTARSLDLRGIEIDPVGIIYLNCPDIDFDTFRDLMAEIRRIDGVKDVRKIQFMPSERHNNELISLLTNLPYPVLSIDLKGAVDIANHAALKLLAKTEQEAVGQQISSLIPSFNFAKWMEGEVSRQQSTVVIDGIDHKMDILPVYITNHSDEAVLTSIVVSVYPKGAGKTSDMLPDSHALGFEHFVGISNKHKALISQAKKLALLDQPLLITGDTGTGKEMLARACHTRSSRAEHPFLVVSCASMPDDVAETELFGHAPGSFNHEHGHKGIFEQANGGTVLLDEIGEMSPHLQIKMLRLLQDGRFRRVGEEHEMQADVRIIASTRHNLAQLAEAGQFREDLFYRLNVLTLNIPPLCERSSDIAPLLELFITKHSHHLGLTKPSFDEELVKELSQYAWPGNMRQLDNMVLRALTQFTGHELKSKDFNLPRLDAVSSSSAALNLEGSLDDIMKEYESKVLEKLYQAFPSSRKLAKRLNVSHTSIANKLRDYNIRKN
ncbi:transcriptional regulator TyrR [Vibrio hippocampi]|uniref:HTH-type transcriptional regulatory protein TyrR n=1 Tax=Vibrio hippocampi TaxID=654686 RepID=A0ABM8ZHF8_9VIBR|nr:transcriptional regulator TyrR [Vibrio hippocampi]CAH0526136.1 Transcriptional regulatory protein TyrR [Vibrio hippocampi]